MNYLFTYFKEQNWFDVTSIVTNVQPEKIVLTTIKTCLMLFLLFFFSSFASAQNEFITEWKTDNPGTSTNKQITIQAEGTFNYTWKLIGGANTGSGNANGATTITFAVPGNYEVKIKPTGAIPFHAIKFEHEGGDSKKIVKITKWGTTKWSTFENAFTGTKNLEITATDVPDLLLVNDMSYSFSYSNVPTISNINNWNVANVTNMNSLFHFSKFNDDISNWNVSGVTQMNWMFYGIGTFNQNISGWDVSSLENARGMFYGAYQFNQNLGSWNISNVTTADDMFGANMSCENYSKTLMGWAANDSHTPINITLGAFQLIYSPEAVAARNYLINNRGWTITGDALGTCALITTRADFTNLKLFPNPVKDYLTIDGLEGKETLTVYDTTGRLMQTSKANGKELKLNFSTYAKGMYLVTITSEKGSTTKKIIKQ
ncbi:BspA family leucine-rich repeat surface protein [Kaistella antarctica]|uniref:Por secretion system C-terminal sorting domain n=1 Tax=Kaistella antarctica TaxID=266748 RepID=A0A3S4YGV6_9FLAO|nr:BspA family leucine-rich repeat surface protein [Kaistella antarctica]KEY19796.1 hypothetical protein HY04_00780 [Kaistella antarctica]SEV97597.1 Por secretion system C-terminal sorting domain-containing protein [Kaistella antarctica]VEH96449.1 Por secretion system C-terminal sorting domain [Kaistella antarctica]